MKLYTREEFIKLKAPLIYSAVKSKSPENDYSELFHGLFCKTSNTEHNDWFEQDLLAQHEYPEGINDGFQAFCSQIALRDAGETFRTDLNLVARDGMFEDSDRFVVWDSEDVTKLRDYLNTVLAESESHEG